MKTHKDLRVYQHAMNFVIDIYKLTSKFPNEEKYVLCSQMRRAAISIPSNISEGASRNSPKEFIRFLRFSISSLSELETQMEIAKKLKYPNNDFLFDNLISIRRMLINLVKSIKKTL